MGYRHSRCMHRWQANSHREQRRALLFCGMQACLRWCRRCVSNCAVLASLASQLPQGTAQSTAFLWDAGLPAMASAQCQQLRGACIVGKPTPTGIGAEHCFSVGCRLACDGVGGVSATARCLHRWQANSHRDRRRILHFLWEQACLRWLGAGISARCPSREHLCILLADRGALRE